MKPLAILPLALVAFVTSHADAQVVKKGKTKALTPTQQWQGKIAVDALMKEAPPDGFITSPMAFAKLWSAWRGKEDVPKIDFEKEIVLVVTAPGPNTVRMSAILDAQGNLMVRGLSTLIAGPGFGYHIATVPRAGIKSINLKALEK